MSIAEFSATIRSEVYKKWLLKLEKNIVTSTVDSLRSSQQVASKTSFYITEKTVKDMYKTVTGLELSTLEASLFLKAIAEEKTSATGKKGTSGTFKSVAGSSAVEFTTIGFDTITTKLREVFDQYPKVQEAYQHSEEEYTRLSLAELNQDKTLKGRAKQLEIDAIEAEAKRRASFGFFFNKGHVVSIATNLSKKFKDEISKADGLAEAQKTLLISTLSKYIDKLEKDDIASANLPKEVYQDMYASYLKSPDKYLVEIQCSVRNQESGRQSIDVVTELRNIFSPKAKDLEDILRSSSTLGASLVSTEGSPSYINLLAKKLGSIITGVPNDKTVYTANKTLVGTNRTLIKRPASNRKKIADLKKQVAELKSVKSNPRKFSEVSPQSLLNLTSLQALLDRHLQDVISANMGDGSERRVLNYQTGRFAASAKVERLSQSRQGMITAFYSYMKNPYQTFEPGFRQGSPKTRDPKTLISTSIREIAATVVGNKLRAVSV